MFCQLHCCRVRFHSGDRSFQMWKKLSVRVSQFYLYIPVSPVTVCLKNCLQSVQLQYITVSAVSCRQRPLMIWATSSPRGRSCNSHTVGSDWCKEGTEKGSIFWVRWRASEGWSTKMPQWKRVVFRVRSVEQQCDRSTDGFETTTSGGRSIHILYLSKK